MAKTIDPAFRDALREESEHTRDEPYPDITPTRPNRSRVYSIRLSPEEQTRVEKAARDLPPIARAVNMHAGEVTNKAVAETFALPYRGLWDAA